MNCVIRRFQLNLKTVISNTRFKYSKFYYYTDLPNFELVKKTKLQYSFSSDETILTHKLMSDLETGTNDFFVIDNMPSKILIDIDNPKKYRKKKTRGVLGSSKRKNIKSNTSLPSTSKVQNVEVIKVDNPTDKPVAKVIKIDSTLPSTSNNIVPLNEESLPMKNKKCSKKKRVISTKAFSTGAKDEKTICNVRKKKNKVINKLKSAITELAIGPTTKIENVKEKCTVVDSSPIHDDVNYKSKDSSDTSDAISMSAEYIEEYNIPVIGTLKETNKEELIWPEKKKKLLANNSDEEVIFEGHFSRDYLPVQVETAGFFRANLLDSRSKPRSNCTQKRHISSGDSPPHKCKIAKKKNQTEKSLVDLINCNQQNDGDKIYEVLDIASSSDSDTDIRPTGTSNFKDDLIVNVEDNDTKFAASTSSMNNETSSNSADTPESFRDGFEEKMMESDEHNSYPSYTDSDDNASLDQDGENKAVIDVNDSDFVPFKDITLNNIEYFAPITDEVKAERNRYESLRRWELTRLGEQILKCNEKVNGTMFTVLSYNLLAQQLIHSNRSLYKRCNPCHLEWSYRWPLLQHEIRYLNPDIMTLQEVQSSQYNTHYLPWFTYMGYKCIFKKRTGTKVDGCAIIFKANKFEIIEENPVEFYQPKGGQILDRDNVGLIVKLTPTKFHYPFCVATTHILYNPNRADIKLAQTVLFLAELDRICYESEKGGRPTYCPLILTGDFNTEPYSGIVNLICRGNIKYAGMSKRTLKSTNGPVLSAELIPSLLGISDHCQHTNLEQGRYIEKQTGNLFSLADKRKIESSLIKISQPGKGFNTSANSSVPVSAFSSGAVDHAFNFKSVYYFKLDRCNGERAVTTHHENWVTVDYIFYTRVISNSSLIEGDLKLIGRYGLLSAHEAREIGPLPSSFCPSDHFPLAAQFMLKKKTTVR